MVKEVILALGNDMEGEATCHYLNQEIFAGQGDSGYPDWIWLLPAVAG